MIVQLSGLKSSDKQYWLQHIIAPRPIGLVSSVDREGNVNLSPFSFFNIFSSEPPIVIFSPARRLRDNTTKHTLQNATQVPEVVINMVTYDMVEQCSLASSEYDQGVDEFVKAGFTKEKAIHVTPAMVKESPCKLECRVLEIKSLGENAGAGQLVIAEVLCMHITDELLCVDRKFNIARVDLVARLGENYYARINAASIFKLRKPDSRCGMGMDRLPAHIRYCEFLSPNQLARLAGLPDPPEVDEQFRDGRLGSLCYYNTEETQRLEKMCRYAAGLIDEDRIAEAWQVLLRTKMTAQDT